MMDSIYLNYCVKGIIGQKIFLIWIKKTFADSNKNKIFEYDEKLNNMKLEIFESYDIELVLYSLNIDLNSSNMNIGIRNETFKQKKH